VRASALNTAVSTLEVPGLGQPYGLFVLADGTRLVSTLQNSLQLLTPAGQLALIAGDEDKDAGFEGGKGANSRFCDPCGMTVDAAGHIVVTDSENHALRRVSMAGKVSTLAGNGEDGFADGQGEAARFNCPDSVVLAANDEIVVADTGNNAIRVVTPGGAVRTLAGNGEAGFADGQGAAASFRHPFGLARDKDGSILVADRGNHAVRRVTMEGEVSTVAGNGEAGYADGEGAAARFNGPTDVVVDKEGTIVVADGTGAEEDGAAGSGHGDRGKGRGKGGGRGMGKGGIRPSRSRPQQTAADRRRPQQTVLQQTAADRSRPQQTAADRLSCALPRVPHFVGRSALGASNAKPHLSDLGAHLPPPFSSHPSLLALCQQFCGEISGFNNHIFFMVKIPIPSLQEGIDCHLADADPS
jgi:hypothetical protein